MCERARMVFLAGLVGAMVLAGCGGDSVDPGGPDGGPDGGTNAACLPDVSGQAATVTIHIRNEGTTSLFEPSECYRMWKITSPAGDYTPALIVDRTCTSVNNDGCPADCIDETLGNELTPGEERIILWDGVLLRTVDAIAEGCPWAESTGESCFPATCTREVDATAGTHTVDVMLKTDAMETRSQTVTFEYPTQPAIVVTFGP